MSGYEKGEGEGETYFHEICRYRLIVYCLSPCRIRTETAAINKVIIYNFCRIKIGLWSLYCGIFFSKPQ